MSGNFARRLGAASRAFLYAHPTPKTNTILSQMGLSEMKASTPSSATKSPARFLGDFCRIRPKPEAPLRAPLMSHEQLPPQATPSRPLHTAIRPLDTPNLSLPPVLFNWISTQLEQRLRDTPQSPATSAVPWTKEDAMDHILSVLTTLSFSDPIATNFAYSGLGLPPLNGASTAHFLIGTEKFITDLGLKPTFILQYRVALVTQFWTQRGLDLKDAYKMIAQSFFSQTRGGDVTNPINNNLFFRSPLPNDAAPPVGNDLGYGPEVAASRALAANLHDQVEIVTNARNPKLLQPFHVITTGDTGPHAGGFFNSLASMAEMQRRGLPYHGVQIVVVNNAAISTQFAATPKQAAESTLKGLSSYGGLFDTHPVVLSSEDIESGVELMQELVKKSLSTGRLQVLVVRTPRRPGGHASDKPMLNATQLEALANRWTQHLHRLLSTSASKAEISPQRVADILAELRELAKESIKFAMAGDTPLSRSQIHEISSPLTRIARSYPGQIITLEGVEEKTGPVGTTIFGQSLLATVEKYAAQGRKVVCLVQENNDPKLGRCGVYGELDALAKKYPHFIIRLEVNERQQIMTASSLREVSGELAISFLPHQYFLAHAWGALDYTAAPRQLETGKPSTTLTVYNGGDLAYQAKQTGVRFKLKHSNGTTTVEDSFAHARVGVHHNSFNTGALVFENTVTIAPPTMAVSAAILPHALELVDKGAQVLLCNPTRDYGNAQSDVQFPRALSINSILVQNTQGTRSLGDGKKLVVVTYGANADALRKALEERKIDAEVVTVLSNHTPSALVDHLAEKAGKDQVHLVFYDESLGGRFTSEMRITLANQFARTQNIRISTVTPPRGIPPYGNGENLMNPQDLVDHLTLFGGLTESVDKAPSAERVTLKPTKKDHLKFIPAGVPFPCSVPLPPGLAAGKITITWDVEEGQDVDPKKPIGTCETDKTSFEIYPPCAGKFSSKVESGSSVDSKEIHFTVTPSSSVEIRDVTSGQSSSDPTEWLKDPTKVKWESMSQTRQAMAQKMKDKTAYVMDTLDFRKLKSLASTQEVTISAMTGHIVRKAMANLGLHRVLSEDLTQSGTVLEPRVAYAVDNGRELKTVAVDHASQTLQKANQMIVSAQSRPLAPNEASSVSVTAMITIPGKGGTPSAIPVRPDGTPVIVYVGAASGTEASFTIGIDHAIFTGQEANALAKEIQRLINKEFEEQIEQLTQGWKPAVLTPLTPAILAHATGTTLTPSHPPTIKLSGEPRKPSIEFGKHRRMREEHLKKQGAHH